LKEEALDRTMWRARFGRGFGPVVRQTGKLIYIYIYTHTHIQGVPGGMDKTSGECSLC